MNADIVEVNGSAPKCYQPLQEPGYEAGKQQLKRVKLLVHCVASDIIYTHFLALIGSVIYCIYSQVS